MNTNCGLHQTAQLGKDKYSHEALWREFAERDFYADAGLRSVPTLAAAIDLLKKTQQKLAAANLKLHKIASNSAQVLKVFDTEDHVKIISRT